MPTFTLLSGVPASGKSTYARFRRQAEPDTVVISSDARLEEIAARDGITYQDAYVAHADAVRQEIRDAARRAFAAGRDVLWDQTNLTPQVRAELLALVPEHYRRVAVAFEARDALLSERLANRAQRTGKFIPHKVLKAQKDAYLRPCRDEGFCDVQVVRA